MLKFSKAKQVGRRRKKINTDPNAVNLENPLQLQCEGYLNALRVAFVRIPDQLHVEANSEKGLFVRLLTSRLKWCCGPIWNLKRLIKLYFKGKPDLTILFRSGRYIAVELKSRSGEQSSGQRDFEYLVGSNNYYIIRSFDVFRELVDKFRLDEF